MREIWIYIVLTLIFIFSVYGLIYKKEGYTEGTVGSSFVSRIPQGVIVAYNPPNGDVKNIPAGWAACDGSNNTPDLRGKFVLGYNDTACGITSGQDCNGIGNKGGEYNHTLTPNEMAPHTHALTTMTLGGGYSGGSDTHYNTPTTLNTSNGSESGLQGKPHNNMPPFVVLMYIIKL